MPKTFTHENERLSRQAQQPERTAAPGTATATVEEQAARAAWQTYVGSLTAGNEGAPAAPEDRRKRRPGASAPARAADETAPEKVGK